jgi:hypothetical protein
VQGNGEAGTEERVAGKTVFLLKAEEMVTSQCWWEHEGGEEKTRSRAAE